MKKYFLNICFDQKKLQQCISIFTIFYLQNVRMKFPQRRPVCDSKECDALKIVLKSIVISMWGKNYKEWYEAIWSNMKQYEAIWSNNLGQNGIDLY
jgi:hypothetical protein